MTPSKTVVSGVLYLSYDGALEPLGQSQVLPYLRGLAARGVAITLVSFEKARDRANREAVAALGAALRAAGIRWIPLRYHKRPALLATTVDLLAGLLVASWVVGRHRIRVVHARSYVVALIAWILKQLAGIRFIFDMRGFWPDERVEAGLWARGGPVYRVVKRLERLFLRDADEIVTLTERARRTVQSWPGIVPPPITVIPTCVDLARFSGRPFRRPADGAPVFVYAGSLGTWYLLGEMLRFVECAVERFPGTRFLLLSRAQEEIRRHGDGVRFRPGTVTVAEAAPEEMPAWLARADAGLAFYKLGWARQATCPTKVGEYLAMGLPVVVNDAVGDMREVIGETGVGVVLSEFSDDAYRAALRQIEELWADPDLPVRCRRLAESHFSLERGIECYWSIYRRLA